MAKLWHELGKKQPFDNPGEETFVNLVLTTSRLARPVEQLLKARGLSDATYNILRILRGAGDAGRMSGDIGRQLISSVPDVTRLVDGLEKRRLVVRRRSAADRRVVQVFLTPAGAALLATLDSPLRALHQRQVRGLSRPHLRRLNDLLDALRAANRDA